ncbi:organic cation transporter protein [Trichonephila clavipes]|nr:organic cation transporter protein [Trichonephila clavipes]
MPKMQTNLTDMRSGDRGGHRTRIPPSDSEAIVCPMQPITTRELKLLPESPRWLLTHGKEDAALKILSRAAKMNGSHCPNLDTKLKEIISKTNKKCEKQPSSNILQLFKPGLWQKSVVLFYVWCVIAFMYYGITYNTNELAGDPFLNYILYGVVEIMAYILALFFMESRGRKYPIVVSLIVAGASCLLIYPIPDDPVWMRTTLHLLGKLCITCSFSIIFVYTTEIFPTVVRSIGLGSSCLGARLGSLIAPFVRELGRAVHPIVPQVIFGVLAATAGILVLLLPETKGCNVPDTVEDAVRVSR